MYLLGGSSATSTFVGALMRAGMGARMRQVLLSPYEIGKVGRGGVEGKEGKNEVRAGGAGRRCTVDTLSDILKKKVRARNTRTCSNPPRKEPTGAAAPEGPTINNTYGHPPPLTFFIWGAGSRLVFMRGMDVVELLRREGGEGGVGEEWKTRTGVEGGSGIVLSFDQSHFPPPPPLPPPNERLG